MNFEKNKQHKNNIFPTNPASMVGIYHRIQILFSLCTPGAGDECYRFSVTPLAPSDSKGYS